MDGEDFGWLWDVDFESMAPLVERVVVSGTRADELANRLHYAGVSAGQIRIIVDRPRRARRGPDGAAGRRSGSWCCRGYTPLIELRNEMRRRGWTGRYWAV